MCFDKERHCNLSKQLNYSDIGFLFSLKSNFEQIIVIIGAILLVKDGEKLEIGARLLRKQHKKEKCI